MVCAAAEIRLGPAVRHGTRDTRRGHELRLWNKLQSSPSREIFAVIVPQTARSERCSKGRADHGDISRLARSAARSANPPGGIGNWCVTRIFSTTPSIK